MPQLTPIPYKPALFIPKEKIIIVADLHIGIEQEFTELGAHVPSQTPTISKNLFSLCETYAPTQLILLGDIKHNIPSPSWQERKDVRNFLTDIASYAEVHIVPGNHDGNIDRLVPPSVTLHPSSGFSLPDINVGFVHGHRWPRKEVMHCDKIVMAHTHPTVMLKDSLGYQAFAPCWLRGGFLPEETHDKYPDAKNPTVVIMPAFNALCGGSAINKDGVVGPMGNILDIDELKIFLLDGSSLGKVEDLQ